MSTLFADGDEDQGKKMSTLFADGDEDDDDDVPPLPAPQEELSSSSEEEDEAGDTSASAPDPKEAVVRAQTDWTVDLFSWPHVDYISKDLMSTACARLFDTIRFFAVVNGADGNPISAYAFRTCRATALSGTPSPSETFDVRVIGDHSTFEQLARALDVKSPPSAQTMVVNTYKPNSADLSKQFGVRTVTFRDAGGVSGASGFIERVVPAWIKTYTAAGTTVWPFSSSFYQGVRADQGEHVAVLGNGDEFKFQTEPTRSAMRKFLVGLPTHTPNLYWTGEFPVGSDGTGASFRTRVEKMVETVELEMLRFKVLALP